MPTPRIVVEWLPFTTYNTLGRITVSDAAGTPDQVWIIVGGGVAAPPPANYDDFGWVHGVTPLSQFPSLQWKGVPGQMTAQVEGYIDSVDGRGGGEVYWFGLVIEDGGPPGAGRVLDAVFGPILVHVT